MLGPSTTTTTTTGHLHTKRHVAAAVIGAAHLSIARLGRLCARELHRHEPAAQLELRHADEGVLSEEAEPSRADAPVQGEPHTREYWDRLVRGSSLCGIRELHRDDGAEHTAAQDARPQIDGLLLPPALL